MPLLFVGKDPESQGGNCPTVLVDDETFDLVFQGTKADQKTQVEAGEFGSLPDTEGIVRIPARMVPLIREACDVAERRGL
ncbi:hypothetical protein GXW83_18930 [Streptacidiphilus sp. PB12-B1b]|nr:hypothetical protein [Streptacidiphilus sp. PB12-B1b]QMU80387.1 hypothetical protein GXW83_18930 [Streptacidiphilus sp. PB12-B1b]